MCDLMPAAQPAEKIGKMKKLRRTLSESFSRIAFKKEDSGFDEVRESTFLVLPVFADAVNASALTRGPEQCMLGCVVWVCVSLGGSCQRRSSQISVSLGWFSSDRTWFL
ncbi:cyclin-dependent kinase 14 [Puntigrus tetrazona]|uniref:cyclin-dependent kinase 14 n=1 Tax=Puntigrus tetrazona TaxID=1606681 RepID=UPI001C892FD8|nr:cyclin-dependent kinase 14 [Puntigrus tetrazona]